MSHLAQLSRIRRGLPAPPIAKAIRESAGVTQAEVAAELGVSAVTVYRWEAGQRTPRTHHRQAYALLLLELQDRAA